MEEIVLVFTTLPDGFDTQTLAEALVADRHAACVSVLPLQTSTYRWQAAIETAREHQVIIKTTAPRVEGLRQALRSRHPYELPEFLVIPVSGGDHGYVHWLRGSLAERLA